MEDWGLSTILNPYIEINKLFTLFLKLIIS